MSVFAPPPELPTLSRNAVDRRDFLRICTMAAAAAGHSFTVAATFAEAAAAGLKPPVIRLHFQERTDRTESLLRTSHPAVSEMILDLISLDSHETLFAAPGHRAERALPAAMAAREGRYVCVAEGAIPVKARTARGILQNVGGRAAAVVAIGSVDAPGGLETVCMN